MNKIEIPVTLLSEIAEEMQNLWLENKELANKLAAVHRIFESAKEHAGKNVSQIEYPSGVAKINKIIEKTKTDKSKMDKENA